jgi:hypothetical protein
MKQFFKPSRILFATILACALSAFPTNAMAQENIALGKKAEFNTPPNYELSSDANDAKQLTDGIYSSRGNLQEVENTTAIWVQKSTVGWTGGFPIITIDLEKVQPISGISYSTAAGRAGVDWPTNIYVAVSDDKINWHYLGDLKELSKAQPPAQDYAAFQYVTHDLHTKGRYVALAIASSQYVFTDEIEVFRGQENWLNEPADGAKTIDLQTLLLRTALNTRVKNRLNADIAAMRERVAEANLDADRRSAQGALLTAQQMAIADLELPPLDLKTILPLNDTHERIFALHGELLKAQGFAPLTIWKTHRYAWLSHLATPPKNNVPVALRFSMLQNQHRSDAFLLTNVGSTPKTVSLQVSNPPRGAQENWLQVFSVAWTDTRDNIPVADALLPATENNSASEIEIPAGMTRKVWLIVDSSKLPSGDTGSTLQVRDGETISSIPLKISIAKIAMPTPRLSLGMWDYTDVNGYGGITLKNRDAAIALMRSHYVDTPWATPASLPRAAAQDFDDAGNLTKPLDFSRFDVWVTRWPDARNYFVFAAVDDSFAGVKIDAPEFAPRVQSWAKALSAHMKELKLKPQQLGLLLVDEPRNDEQDLIIAAWAKAINAAAPELTLFSDPNWIRPDEIAHQDAITQMDILCPQVPIYEKGGAPVKAYFESLRKSGKTLWNYQCTGPIRTYSPQLYYRYNAWHAFAMGAIGEGFWAFGDTSGAPTSWQSYLATSVGFDPAFLGEDSATNSLHWEAVREGIEDYEELAMLRDAIAASKNSILKAQAQKVLDEAVGSTVGIWESKYVWNTEADPALADQQLSKVRAMLIRLRS